jgi:hypothetical protein
MQSEDQTILAQFKDEIGNRAEQRLIKLLAALQRFVDVSQIGESFRSLGGLGGTRCSRSGGPSVGRSIAHTAEVLRGYHGRTSKSVLD